MYILQIIFMNPLCTDEENLDDLLKKKLHQGLKSILRDA